MSHLDSEGMQRAAINMQAAADQMQRVFSWWDEMLARRERWEREFIERLEALERPQQGGR